MFIIDIMDEKGNLSEWEKAKQKYDFNMFSNLSWLGLIKSIPAVWKSNLRNSFSGSPPSTELQNEDIACIDSKMACLKLIQPLSKPPTCQLYFEKVPGFGKVEWKKVYMLPIIVTIDSSLRSFQYKILDNILYLNGRLYKFNIVESPLCSLCGAYNEQITHLFCTCTVHEVISFPILEPKTVILGLWSEKTSNYILINHIILIFKRYIFLKRKESKHISFNRLKALLKMSKIPRIK